MRHIHKKCRWRRRKERQIVAAEREVAFYQGLGPAWAYDVELAQKRLRQLKGLV